MKEKDDMLKVKGTWGGHLKVECPHCNGSQSIELDKIDEWWMSFPLCESKEDIRYMCAECGKEFIIDSASW